MYLVRVVAHGAYGQSKELQAAFISMYTLWAVVVVRMAATSPTVGSSCSNLTEGIMLGSGSHGEVQVASVATCCAACAKEPLCVAFTFDGLLNHTGATVPCFLKTNAENTGRCNKHPHQAGCVSGTVPGRKPQPSPAPSPPPHLSGYNTACRADSPAGVREMPFCDPSLTHEQRLDDLVPRINISEMGSQLTARESSALSRLGIPAYYYGTNALHAFREAPCVKGVDGGAIST